MEDERKSRAEQLLREAHIYRMRGQFGDAEGRCREALALIPDDPTALEMLGDFLHEKGALDEAAEHYRTVLAVQPNRASAETKLARVVLAQGERQHQRDMAQSMLLMGDRSSKERKRNVTVSFLLSLCFAGGGQIYNGDLIKGGVLLTLWLIGAFFGFPSLIKLMIGATGRRPDLGPSIAGIGLESILGFIALFVWVYSLIDAPSVAAKRGRNDDFI